MSSHNEPVKPTAFTLAQPEPEAAPLSDSGTARGLPNWVMPALIGLVLLALLVVFWLPGRFDEQLATPAPAAQTTEATAAPAASNPGKARSDTQEASPWSEAQLAKMRKAAQDILAILLDVQFELQEIGVEQWAPEAFDAAKAIAADGDLQYRERQFVEARDSYEQALMQMEALAESAAPVLQKNLALARQAIEASKREAARAALDIATLIEPSNPVLANLSRREQTLEQLIPLMSQALEKEEVDDLASAESLLQQATALDPEHLGARAELDRVVAKHTRARFNLAMSEGYGALDEGQFSTARGAFREAGKLSPGSAEASAALQDLETAETAWRLGSLQTRGRKEEAAEQWQEAVETFEEALEIDANLLFAQQGLKRARARSQLDRQFRAAIDTPGRLADQAVAEATATLLRQAASIDPRGPVLNKQLATLEGLLKQAAAQIQLTLRSDGQTDVTLRKVSRLGQFSERILTVRPGTYTVIGSRNGYRDIRHTFTLKHDSVAFDIEIVCTEKI